MALPRSTIAGAVVKSTGQKFVAVTVGQTLTNATTVVPVTVSSRKFAVGEQTVAWFDIQENGGGYVMIAGPVTGNKPNYTCNVSFYNPTGSTIVSGPRTFWLAQE